MPNVQAIDVHSEPGWIIIQRASGPPVRYPIADLLRAEDVPILSEEQSVEKIPSVSMIAGLITILLKTLIEFQVLSDEFHNNVQLDYIINRLEALGEEW